VKNDMEPRTYKIIALCLIGFLAICSLCIFGTSKWYDYRVGQLNQELGRSKSDYQQLELEYRAIEQSNSVLGKRLDSIQRGVGEAKDLTNAISGQGKTASEQIRGVIENLKKIRTILENIGNI